MLSRTKTNLRLLLFDGADEINVGVQRDELVGTATRELMVRRITFNDVVAERQFELLTNVLAVVLAQFCRGELPDHHALGIKKSFDEVKNNLEIK